MSNKIREGGRNEWIDSIKSSLLFTLLASGNLDKLLSTNQPTNQLFNSLKFVLLTHCYQDLSLKKE